MTEHAELFARLESEQPPISCGMRHPAYAVGNRPGPTKATPCTRPAVYFATIHDCTKQSKSRRVTVCAHYLDVVKQIPFPGNCAGCGYLFSTMNTLIWDLEHVHH